MSTNYYFHHVNKPEDEEPIHLGKRSSGWKFAYRGYHPGDMPEYAKSSRIENINDLLNFVLNNPGVIRSEYGQPLSYIEFINMTDETRHGKAHKSTPFSGEVKPDSNGFPFCFYDFC